MDVRQPVSQTGPVLSRARRRAVLGTMCLSLVLVIASMSSLNIALPDLAVGLGASGNDLTWIADAYTVTLAALVLPFGALGDRFGRRTLLLAGTAIFGVAAALAATAGSVAVLIAFRALMGVGAAMIMPATLSTITAVFPEEERARAVGLWAGFASAGGILGMIGAGALLEDFWWGSTFAVTAALAAVAFVVTAVVAPNTADEAHTNLDPLGALFSFAGIGTLVFGIIEGSDQGWTEPVTFAAFAVAALSIAAFVAWELRVERPMLDPRLFLVRGFGTGSFVLLLQFIATFGFFFVGMQFLQLILGYGPLESAVALLPIAVVIVPLAANVPRLAARLGNRVVVVAGLAAMLTSFLSMTQFDRGTGYGEFLVGLLLFGSGIALVTTPATNAILSSMPLGKQGVASAMNDATREVGAALGIATLGSLFNQGYRDSLGDGVAGLPPAAAHAVRDSAAAGLEVARQLGDAGAQLADRVRDAFMHGLGTALTAGAVALALGLAFVLWRPLDPIEDDEATGSISARPRRTPEVEPV